MYPSPLTAACGVMLLAVALSACGLRTNRQDGSANTESSASKPHSIPCKPLRNEAARGAIFAAASGVVRSSYAVSRSSRNWPDGYRLSERLMNFYMDNRPPCGLRFSLTERETRQVLAESEVDGKPVDVRRALIADTSGGRWRDAGKGSFDAWVRTLPDGSHRVSSAFLAYGKSHWTNLHGMDIQFQPGGTFVKRGARWSYFAKITVNDYWDPDAKPWGDGSRDPGVEAITRAWQQAPGNPFDVTSAAICVSQDEGASSIFPSDCANLK